MTRALSARPLPLFAAFTFGLLAVAGCGDKTKLAPVSGKVTGDGGQALTGGVVTFQPDESKGNSSKIVPSGTIDGNGNYKLLTNGQEGAPLGWYKVGVNPATMGGTGGDIGVSDPMKALTKGGNVNQKFQNPGTSGISIEVTESPGGGAYDIKVTK